MPPDSFSVPAAIIALVLALALVGVLLHHVRVRRDLAQARGQLAQARQEHEHRTRETSATEQRLAHAERQAQESAELLREARAQQELVRAETEHLITKRVPALLSHLRSPHVIVPGVQHQALAGTDVDRQHRALLDAFTRGVREEGERIDEAAQAVIRGAMSRVQTQALRAQDLLAGVQQRYSGDEHTALLREVLGLDMFNELIIRRVQVTGIACGATPGLSRDDTYLVDLMVGAISRVENFEQRIEGPANHLRRRIGVAARAAESILFITAELLANAVHHSYGTLKVTIAVHETNNGAAIVIDDAGVGLNEEQYARATRLLSGTQLSPPRRPGQPAPHRLGRHRPPGRALRPAGHGQEERLRRRAGRAEHPHRPARGDAGAQLGRRCWRPSRSAPRPPPSGRSPWRRRPSPRSRGPSPRRRRGNRQERTWPRCRSVAASRRRAPRPAPPARRGRFPGPRRQGAHHPGGCPEAVGGLPDRSRSGPPRSAPDPAARHHRRELTVPWTLTALLAVFRPRDARCPSTCPGSCRP
ncbi:hypothetical protein ACFSTC_39055 [Nonomuraea ferruginea]